MADFLSTTSWNFPQIKWLDRHMEGHRGFIAGGAFKQIFTGGKVKDIDIFFETKEDFAKAQSKFAESDDYHKYYDSPKVEAYKCIKTGVTIELVKKCYGNAETTIGKFDFTITKFAYYKHVEEDEFGAETLTYRCAYHPLYFEHLSLKRLVIDDNIPLPANTFDRMFRYGKYGYFPCRETKMRVITALREMPEGFDLSRSMYDGLD